MKKFTIVAITDWEKDSHMMDGDACHIPLSDVLFKEANEYREKVEEGKWPNLPFTCEAESKEDAIEKYNNASCEYDYIRAIDAEFEGDDEEDEEEEA